MKSCLVYNVLDSVVIHFREFYDVLDWIVGICYCFYLLFAQLI